jgi:hypothetical protein
LAQGTPGSEPCDAIDDNCAGSVDEVKETRYVAETALAGGGSNLCTSPSFPGSTVDRSGSSRRCPAA